MSALPLSTLLTRLENNLRIVSGETGVFGTTAERTALLNEGAKKFVKATGILQKSGNITSVDGTQEYDLLSNFSDYLRISKEGGVFYNTKKITYRSLTQLALKYGPDWQTMAEGTPEEYYIRGKRYLGLVTTPDTSSLTVKVYYVYKPTEMSAVTDYPFIPTTVFMEDYHEAPLLYATWKLLIRGRQIQEAMSYRGEFFAMIKDCNGEEDEEATPTLVPDMSIYRS